MICAAAGVDSARRAVRKASLGRRPERGPHIEADVEARRADYASHHESSGLEIELELNPQLAAVRHAVVGTEMKVIRLQLDVLSP
jgi:hypothetical protein